MVALSLAAPQRFLSIATRLNELILAIFSNGFALAAFGFVLTCIWAALSPLGRIRIGGKNAQPLLSRWNWAAITLTTTIAIGILFWGTAEPLYHLYDPGGTQLTPGSPDAARFSMVSLLMHWTFTPYAIYTIPGLTFALVYYNLKAPFSLASPLTVLTGRPAPTWVADSVDALALLALLLGLAASLGTGILSISGGVARLSPWEAGPVMTGIVAMVIISAFFVSSATGLNRGIRILSDINTKIFLALIIFVVIAGPSIAIFKTGGQAIVDYGREFISRSVLLAPFDNRDWLNSWTVFYFANWMAWAPLAGLFLGRISRGYLVREYILVNLVLPALFSFVWMIIFGGFTLDVEMNNPQSLNSVLQTSGPEHIIYLILDYLPLAGVLAALVVVISFLSYVTAADSNMDVIAKLCVRETGTPQSPRTGIFLKLIWALAIGLAAWIMTTLSGIDGIKMLSNLGGLPALFIICAFNLVLIVLGTFKFKQLSEC